MKSTRDFRSQTGRPDSNDSMRKEVKLDPIKKSGKDKYAMYGELEEDDGIDNDYKKKESILDYFDDVEEVEHEDYDEEDEEEYEEEDEDEYNEDENGQQ